MYGMPDITTEDMIRALHLIDSKLDGSCEIRLCGTNAVALQFIDFRLTGDFDFTVIPNEKIQIICTEVALELGWEPRIFDTKAAGVVCLLDDYEDRLVEFDGGFKYLKVRLLSLLDWAVSKFEAPKIDDLIDYDVVDAAFLETVEDHMYKYAGRDIDAARSGLRHVLSGRRIKEDLLSKYTMEQINEAWEHLTEAERKSSYKKMFAVHKYEQKLIDAGALTINNN
jgi:hypothetical protein